MGGGTGKFARAIAEVFPSVTCTMLELPNVVADLEESERVQFVGGDMFDYVPPAQTSFLNV